MNPKTKVMEILLAEPEKFNEFIMCLFNRGLGDIEFGYCNDQNFYYQITKKTFNINNIFIFSDDSCYFEKASKSDPNINMITLISTEKDLDSIDFDSKWKKSIRKQFTKSKESFAPPLDFTLLNKNHKWIIEKSESIRVKDNYELAIEYDDECYGIIYNDELVSFLSISKIDNEQIKLAEINWIFTEPKYRKQGYAAKLLQNVSNLLLQRHYLISYHCVSSNIASAKTAFKSGMKEVIDEIIYERND